MNLSIAICLLLFTFGISAHENPFANLVYDKVVAYEYNGQGMRTIDYVLSNNQRLLDNQLILDSLQIKEFETIITEKDAYGQLRAMCFDPHFAVVYYLGDSSVAQIDVCLLCNYLISSVEIPAIYDKKVEVVTEYERPLKGFSKTTRKELDEFIGTLKFDKYREPLESIYDE